MAGFQPLVQRYNFPRGNSVPFNHTITDRLPSLRAPSFKANDGQGFQRGVKRKGFHLPAANIPAKQPVQQFFCELCNVQLNSIQQAEQHEYGKIHKNKAKVLEQLTSNGVKSTNTPVSETQAPITPTPLQAKNKNCGVSLNCIICQKVFNSTIQAEQHFKSQMHHHKIQGIVEGRLAPSEGTVTSSKVTMLPASKAKVALEELTSLRTTEGTVAAGQPTPVPRSKLTVLQLQGAPKPLEPSLTPSAVKQGHFLASENESKIAPVTLKTFYCDTCHVASNSSSQYQLHIQGARHKNAVSQSYSLDTSVSEVLDGISTKGNSTVDKTRFYSKKQPEKHVATPAHRRPASGMSPISKPKTSSVDSRKRRSSPLPLMFYCEDCATSFNSQKQLVQHLTSIKHMKKAQRKWLSTTPSNFKGREKEHGKGSGRGEVSRGKSNMGSSGYPGVLLNANSAPSLSSSFIRGT